MPELSGGPTAASDFLRLFVIEKALYEIAYELANQPDWACIPLASLLAMVEGSASPGSTGSRRSSKNDDREQSEDMPRGSECATRAHTMPFGSNKCF
jgi:glycogen debranching enzyme